VLSATPAGTPVLPAFGQAPPTGGPTTTGADVVTPGRGDPDGLADTAADGPADPVADLDGAPDAGAAVSGDRSSPDGTSAMTAHVARLATASTTPLISQTDGRVKSERWGVEETGFGPEGGRLGSAFLSSSRGRWATSSSSVRRRIGRHPRNQLATITDHQRRTTIPNDAIQFTLWLTHKGARNQATRTSA
jgi:hypothetical protein